MTHQTPKQPQRPSLRTKGGSETERGERDYPTNGRREIVQTAWADGAELLPRQEEGFSGAIRKEPTGDFVPCEVSQHPPSVAQEPQDGKEYGTGLLL